MKSTAIPAAVAVALIICLCSSKAAHAQTADKPQAQSKPAAKPRAKPQAKPAAQPKETAAQEVPGRKSVCVASFIGHQFAVQKIGLMVFGNALDKVAIDNWGVDDAALRTIANYLGKDFTVRRLPSAKAAIPDAVRLGGGVQFRASAVELVRAAVAGTPKCNYYLSLMPDVARVGGGNQVVDGLGILNMGIPDRFYLFASFRIELFDGDNFNSLKTFNPKTDLVPFNSAFPNVVYRQVDNTFWPAAPQTAAQNGQLKNGTRALVEEGLRNSFKYIFEAS